MTTEKPTAVKVPHKSARPHGKQLTPKQWAEAGELWESGEVTLPELAKKFGKAEETFSRRFKLDGLVKGSKKEIHAAAVREKVRESIVDDVTVLSGRIRETKEEHYKMAQAIGKLTWNEVLQAKQRGDSMATILPAVKALQEAAKTLAIVRQERWVVLGLDNPNTENDNDLPELLISELTAEQINEMNQRQVIEFGSEEIEELSEIEIEGVEE